MEGANYTPEVKPAPPPAPNRTDGLGSGHPPTDEATAHQTANPFTKQERTQNQTRQKTPFSEKKAAGGESQTARTPYDQLKEELEAKRKAYRQAADFTVDGNGVIDRSSKHKLYVEIRELEKKLMFYHLDGLKNLKPFELPQFEPVATSLKEYTDKRIVELEKTLAETLKEPTSQRQKRGEASKPQATAPTKGYGEYNSRLHTSASTKEEDEQPTETPQPEGTAAQVKNKKIGTRLYEALRKKGKGLWEALKILAVAVTGSILIEETETIRKKSTS